MREVVPLQDLMRDFLIQFHSHYHLLGMGEEEDTVVGLALCEGDKDAETRTLQLILVPSPVLRGVCYG